MDEPEVIQEIRLFFERKGWKVTFGSYPNHFEVDILAEKGETKYFIQAKGDRWGQEYYQIQYALGQTAAVMHEESPGIRYGIALTEAVARNLWKFGVAGLKALNLHVFIVDKYGPVYHLAPEAVLEYIKELRRWGETCTHPSTLSTDP